MAKLPKVHEGVDGDAIELDYLGAGGAGSG
jgi:hypothetical protein